PLVSGVNASVRNNHLVLPDSVNSWDITSFRIDLCLGAPAQVGLQRRLSVAGRQSVCPLVKVPSVELFMNASSEDMNRASLDRTLLAPSGSSMAAGFFFPSEKIP